MDGGLGYHQRMVRVAEERSLELHRAVAARIVGDPRVVDRALGRVRGWQADGSVHREYAERWRALLEGPREALLAMLVDRAEEACALRQVTPFAGVVAPRDRWRIWREVLRRVPVAP